MKRSAVFILSLLTSAISAVYACGPYYPFGDDIRFTLLKPGIFNYAGFSEFSYTADIFYTPEYSNDIASPKDSIDENILLWRKRCKNIPTIIDTYNAIYVVGDEINNVHSANTFISYLHKNHDTQAIDYLTFAKRCSPFNTLMDDPWERDDYAKVPERTQLIQQALQRASTSTDADLALRYAFLAIRLAYYNRDFDIIKNTYNQHFAKRTPTHIIDYWAMYFMAFTETDSVKMNFYASQVFFNAPDKRKQIYLDYNPSVPVEKTLALCRNNTEKSAVWVMEAFRKPGKNADIFKKIYALNPKLPALSFLVLREVNKLEDWIYTPYYTRFNPSLEPWDYDPKPYAAQRIDDDRAYAAKLLGFVNDADLQKVENPLLWRIAQAYLNYMAQDFATAHTQIDALLGANGKIPVIGKQLRVLKALCVTAQPDVKTIRDDVKPILMSEFKNANNKFLFAVARELEYKGNTTDAAALLSKLRTRVDDNNEYGYWRNGIYWRTKQNHYTLYVDYYDDYFFYLDAQYSPSQLSELIADIKANKGNSEFDKWKYEVIKKEVPRLYDLLGTKQMRLNNLNEALQAFTMVDDTLWTSPRFPYSTYLAANPFYTNMYNEHSPTAADTICYNKESIAKTLIDYLAKAENAKTKNRDYYYFLVANCYFNMTEYGNSWMMKRYFWTSYIHKTNLEDDDDFYNCTLAQRYYLKAKDVAKSQKFAALCLRMAGRCENYKLTTGLDEQESDSPSTNSYYDELKKKYPKHYKELMGNCESFETYFTARK